MEMKARLPCPMINYIKLCCLNLGEGESEGDS